MDITHPLMVLHVKSVQMVQFQILEAHFASPANLDFTLMTCQPVKNVLVDISLWVVPQNVKFVLLGLFQIQEVHFALFVKMGITLTTPQRVKNVKVDIM